MTIPDKAKIEPGSWALADRLRAGAAEAKIERLIKADGHPEKEPWYKKQARDPTGMGSKETSGGALGGCLAGILLLVIVVFAIAAIR